ncbi:MAG: DNA modification methylase [Gammaproteobacteria bacterium]|nr:DNA modification methylase [Gammaproteobacteria bacterium]
MFPLAFPLGILRRRAKREQAVLDPFCGRGTTNFAAKMLGLGSLGVDSSPVAAAITGAKLVPPSALQIMAEAKDILACTEPCEVPAGEFWEWAYHPDVLVALCGFRTALLQDCSTAVRIALRGIILGALHGPRQKTFQSYFSNQSPRTYAPKPGYAARYWRERNCYPLRVDVLDIIERRAQRYYQAAPEGNGSVGLGQVRLGDSREAESLVPDKDGARFSWVITSPPYYGMRTYISDQWLRYWFLGGAERVDYTSERQIMHSSPGEFASDLKTVWNNAAKVCTPEATLVLRFGGITDRRVDPLELVRRSFDGSVWSIRSVHQAGSAPGGKRQADAFLRHKSKPLPEYDLWAGLA